PAKVKIACKGLDGLLTCGTNKLCQNCLYIEAITVDILRSFSMSAYKEICKFTDIKPLCTGQQWKTIHMKSYPGECVPDAEKLKCVNKADPKATDWETGFYSV